MEAIFIPSEANAQRCTFSCTPRIHSHSPSPLIADCRSHDPPPPSGAPPRIKHDTSLIPHGMKRTEAQ